MATVTKTTVEARIGQYQYRADVDGNAVALFRDGVPAGTAFWNGGRIEPFPDVLSQDARDALEAGIAKNLAKAQRARAEPFGQEVGPEGSPVFPAAPKTADAANRGQMGNEVGRPSRQGEAEVGFGGPGCDPGTGDVGGQACTPNRRITNDDEN